MNNITKLIIIHAILFSFVWAGPALAQKITFLVIDGDSYLVHSAIKDLNVPESIRVKSFIHSDLNQKTSEAFIRESSIIIVDVMMQELSDYLIENNLIQKKNVYALRGSRNDDILRQKGFIFNPDISEYFRHLSVENIQNLIYRVIHRDIDPGISYSPAEKRPELGIYHPDSKEIFLDHLEYMKWYESRGRFNPKAPTLGLMFFSSNLIKGQIDIVNSTIRRFEASGFNVLPCFGRDFRVIDTLLLDKDRNSRVDFVLSFTLKFYSAINDRLKRVLAELDVPIFNAINLYSTTIAEWEKDPVGIPPMDLVWTVANPENSGLIEPMPLSGKEKQTVAASGKVVYVYKPINENFDRMIPRLHKWYQLKKKKNHEKRIALIYYNHSQGKQNIGASYLNVFQSLENILNRLQKEGYKISQDKSFSEAAIKDMILKTGRNIGLWAPGELNAMLEQDRLVQLPLEKYRQWFNRLPEAFKSRVIKQWGPVEKSSIMIKNNRLIIPAVILDNLVILPEPSRGWSDDPMKLYHDQTLYPHHQYIAAYLWIRYGFNADAMIHLGTHATYEWLPGKQAGLSPSCPPEIMVTDLPNIYPYIVDDVGEGIQAKRRGRGVIIDHLTPPLKEGGMYDEYEALHDLFYEYTQAKSVGGKTAMVYLKKIESLVDDTGLKIDLGITQMDEDALEKIHLYLHEIEDNAMPYGLHTFGASPSEEAVKDTALCIKKGNPGAGYNNIVRDLTASGPREMDHLIKALNCKYMPPGEGNDPIRNISAIPTGKNFYGFSPTKIPSRAAWELGKKAAQDIIRKKQEDTGQYPSKVAVVLWATETIRNEGVNESTILFLMGLEPIWDGTGRVTNTRVIPAKHLGRPRIDVFMNPSGLYRDLFPDKMLFLDQAVQKAAAQTDIENLIRKHNRQIKKKLLQSGWTEKQAERFSQFRIFTEKPGSYGNGVSELTSASGFWESDDDIVNVYENRTGFAYGQDNWGIPAKQLLKENLKTVDMAVHSISSNIYGTMDNDDMYQYLGGLSMSVRKESGRTPDTLISMQRLKNKVHVEDLTRTIGRELRTRYLNPKWIEGMQKENYAGAREMSKFVEYMWGWQVTVPDSIDPKKWEQTFEVYVKDKYGMDMKQFFDTHNPWAYQSVTARMLEAVRKDYWKAGEAVKKKLAVEYAVNVVEKGVACCDHTCNNPVLNQMVVNIISLPGLMSPEIVEKFKLAMQKAMGESLDEGVKSRKTLLEKLVQGFTKREMTRKDQTEKAEGSRLETVEGYKMEDLDTRDDSTDLASSGVQWLASIFILMIIGLFVYGSRKRL